MPFMISTGLRNGVLATDSVKALLDGGVLRVYSGTVPADADAAIGSATLLVTISESDTGTGIHFDATPVAGVLVKDTGETWSGTCVASGTASFYRFSGLADAFGLSTTEVRVQGTVGVLLADLLVSSTTFTASAIRQVDSFAIGMPDSA